MHGFGLRLCTEIIPSFKRLPLVKGKFVVLLKPYHF